MSFHCPLSTRFGHESSNELSQHRFAEQVAGSSPVTCVNTSKAQGCPTSTPSLQKSGYQLVGRNQAITGRIYVQVRGWYQSAPRSIDLSQQP
jgi:hypothetical protein